MAGKQAAAGLVVPKPRTGAKVSRRRPRDQASAEPAQTVAPGFELPSFMSGTNGGGAPESVPGFDLFQALTAGFSTRRVAGPTVLASRPDGGFFSQARPAAPTPAGGWAPKPENVIGPDNRAQVNDTTLTPWRCICHLEVEFETGPVGVGTGFLIGPRTVLTAAHVLVDRRPSAWATLRRARRVRVVPGRNGGIAPYGFFVSEKLNYPDIWTSKKATPEECLANDYAAIQAPEDEQVQGEPLGKRLGYFGLKALEESPDARLLLVNNAGYPYEADKPYGSLWYNAGRVHSIDPVFVEYMVDTEGGQSGSPVYFFDQERNQRLVVAIHTTGDFVNRGLRITPAIFKQLCAWAPRQPD